ncbi:chondroitinase (chondroitin lyase) [gut metagenome]|uniref:Chondroitinase (Chondroitin lyase) n=1 Tax=gut metagenome TaxID=749906 RepID=J9DAD5_9ZZZZ
MEGFEEAVPVSFTSPQKKALSLSDRYYKEGRKSLEWSFQPGGEMNVALDTPLALTAKTEATHGITLWIYNEKEHPDSLRFEFLNAAGKVSYWFTYRLQSKGWRACWVGFKSMRGDKSDKTIAAYRVVAPNRKGRVFFDRLKFPEQKMNLRTTPDMQVDYNSLAVGRDLWHWCRVWEWEQYTYDIPRPTSVTEQQVKDLKQIEERLTEALGHPQGIDGAIKKAKNTFTKADIYPSGAGFTGAPLLAPDELNRKKGEMSWNDLEAMLTGFAYDAYCNKSYEAENNYFTVWDYAIDQGFAYGSGMGTNHHYGYQTRKIYTTAWLMRKAIWKSSRRDEILKALTFWSALQETRRPCAEIRDELLDSWNTLLEAKLISAMLMPDDADRVQALKGLTRWVEGSVHCTPGTIGGIKVDGTTFHHGGFYPAYTTGALSTVCDYIDKTRGTEFMPSMEARQLLASAFLAMRNYSNLHEWNTGIGGRHPFGGKMGGADIKAFAQLALSGDFSGKGEEFDRSLAADYLRLIDGKNTPEARFFKDKGVQPAAAPKGFFVYNYGAAGIHRRGDWMVTLKGYNTNVWGSEIYQKDNRYGRYTSYGSVQIMSFPSREKSGYVEEGWDWNRLPGTTTIHLPLNLLENPRKGTLMARSPEEFAGASSLEGKNGMFAIKLAEANYENFTPDFRARKSVFCFDNRLVCLGTDITNSNAQYPTETTLFQSEYRQGKNVIAMMGREIDRPSFGAKMAGGSNCWLRDGYGNHYQVLEGLVRIQVASQESANDKTKVATAGTFGSAFLVHGLAPKAASYAYAVYIQPTADELAAVQKQAAFDILRRDTQLHAVYDHATGITGYAAFEDVALVEDKTVTDLPAETMVMHRTTADGTLVMSVCDPNLHIKEKTYTTPEPSAPFVKVVHLKGQWQLAEPHDQVELSTQGGLTELKVTCQHGQPVEFRLKK